MNKRQALKAVVFVLIFLFLLRSVTYMLRTNGTVKEIFVGFYAEPKDTIDVVMIGSSPVYPYYIAPKIWGEHGITCYPLSSNQQRPRAAVYLVEEALKTQSPGLFIFELRQYAYDESMMTENMAYTRGVTDNLKYSLNRFNLINDMVSNPSERYTYYFDIFKYHSNWKTIILPDQYTAFLYEREHPLKGYELNTDVVAGEGKDYSSLSETMQIPAEQEEMLYRLLDYLQENDLDALFLVSPMKMDGDMQKKFNYMEEIIAKYGYRYLNLNDYYEELDLDFATDFYDGGGHTNILGAEKCTEFLGRYLTEYYDFEDKRGDEKYDSWQTSYEYWQECRSGGMETVERNIESAKKGEEGKE